MQTRFVGIANSEITLLPDIPAQNDLSNNEYLLSVATRYTAPPSAGRTKVSALIAFVWPFVDLFLSHPHHFRVN